MGCFRKYIFKYEEILAQDKLELPQHGCICVHKLVKLHKYLCTQTQESSYPRLLRLAIIKDGAFVWLSIAPYLLLRMFIVFLAVYTAFSALLTIAYISAVLT